MTGSYLFVRKVILAVYGKWTGERQEWRPKDKDAIVFGQARADGGLD